MFKYVDSIFCVLPKWKEDAKEFTVSVNYNEMRGYQSSIPRPIMDLLGDPEKITFVVSGANIKLISSDEMTLKEKRKYR